MCEDNKVPNLDATDDSDLAEFIHHHAGGRNWAELFPTGHSEIHARLATATLVHYAYYTTVARKYRVAGSITKALKAEAQAANEYASLPEWAQW